MRAFLFSTIVFMSHAAIAQQAADISADQLEMEAHPLALPSEVNPPSRAQGTPTERETELNESFNAAEIAHADLEDVSCEGPTCKVEVSLSSGDPRDRPAQLNAIEDWISNSSACPYALASDPGTGPKIRASINCDE